MSGHPFLPSLRRPLVLASQSPRRRHLLEAQGVDFAVIPAHIDERPLPDETEVAHAERLALEKARAVAARHRDAAVLGSDTIVVVDGAILGKPDDKKAAVSMLEELSGRWHEVVSSVALVCEDSSFARILSERTRVRFRDLGRDEILDYVDSGEPLDKAGAYGIQALGALLVREIEGCYFNVMGLPLQRVRQLMWEFEKSAATGITSDRDGEDEQ